MWHFRAFSDFSKPLSDQGGFRVPCKHKVYFRVLLRSPKAWISQKFSLGLKPKPLLPFSLRYTLDSRRSRSTHSMGNPAFSLDDLNGTSTAFISPKKRRGIHPQDTASALLSFRAHYTSKGIRPYNLNSQCVPTEVIYPNTSEHPTYPLGLTHKIIIIDKF